MEFLGNPLPGDLPGMQYLPVDSALLKAFGEAGTGVFAGPTVIAEEICRMYRMAVIGETDEIKERFYAISPERRLKHASVVMITDTARSDLFTAS